MVKSLRKFHRDERGLEALQVIMIVAIAAIILALLKFAWPGIKKWFIDNVKNTLGFGTGDVGGSDTGGSSTGTL